MKTTKKKKSRSAPPWERKAPAGGRHTKLSPTQKAAAKRAAKKAGRPYPNLIDNMNAAQSGKASPD